MLARLVTTLSAVFVVLSASILQAVPAGDRIIQVGDHKLHIVEAGTGSPVVVFESGLGEDVSTWSDVQPAVAKFAHTVMYDRAGIGKSESSSTEQSVEGMVNDLHEVLHAAGIRPPYILVGHSLGGALVQVFAHRYPFEVSGLALVDPEDGTLLERLQQQMSSDEWSARRAALEKVQGDLPAVVKAEMDAMARTGEYVREMSPLPQVPIVLLTATQENPEFPGNPQEHRLKQRLHEELLARNPGIVHILVPNSRHYIQSDAPAVVIKGVRDVVSKAK
jgi:pimeloyl-ACP methyl ester carboxylesterase